MESSIWYFEKLASKIRAGEAEATQSVEGERVDRGLHLQKRLVEVEGGPVVVAEQPHVHEKRDVEAADDEQQRDGAQHHLDQRLRDIADGLDGGLESEVLLPVLVGPHHVLLHFLPDPLVVDLCHAGVLSSRCS